MATMQYNFKKITTVRVDQLGSLSTSSDGTRGVFPSGRDARRWGKNEKHRERWRRGTSHVKKTFRVGSFFVSTATTS